MYVVKIIGRVCFFHICDLWKNSPNDFDHARLKLQCEAP